MPVDNDIHLLLVENDELTREVFFRSILGHFPQLKAEVASNIDEAIQLLTPNKYDIIVCDAFIPHDNKISFVKCLCGIIQNKPAVIVITGDTDIAHTIFSTLTGVCMLEVIYKPIDVYEFIRKLQGAIDMIKGRRVNKNSIY